MTTPEFDLLIKNVRVVRPHGNVVHDSDIAIKDGQFALVAPGIDVARAKKVHDGQHRLAFPGVVDAHMHSGIYSPLIEDAVSESKAAAMGGVTSSLNYFRTGQYYLNKGGPYKKFYPEVLKTSKGRFHVDYGFHLAPMDGTHIKEIPELIEKYGVSSFKIFMFYGSHGLHGASNSQREFLMIGEDERYDYAHFEFIMRGVQAAREQFPERARQISLSLHCETAEVMTAYTKLVEKDESFQKPGMGLAAYSASRPQHSEGLAVFIASYLAHETALPNINLLHLSSRKAVQAAMMMADVFPHIDFKREVTIGHLMLDINSKAAERGRRVHGGGAAGRRARLGGQRPRLLPPRDEDPEALFRQHLDGQERLRRHRVPAARAGQRGHAPWHGLQPHGARDQLEPGAALWPEPQGGHCRGLRRRPRAGGPSQDLDHRGQGFTVDPGLHALRGAGAVGARGGNLPARPPHLPGRRGHRQAARPVPAPPDGMTRRPFAPGLSRQAR